MINYLVALYLVVCGIATGDALTFVAAGVFAVAGAIACADFSETELMERAFVTITCDIAYGNDKPIIKVLKEEEIK